MYVLEEENHPYQIAKYVNSQVDEKICICMTLMQSLKGKCENTNSPQSKRILYEMILKKI